MEIKIHEIEKGYKKRITLNALKTFINFKFFFFTSLIMTNIYFIQSTSVFLSFFMISFLMAAGTVEDKNNIPVDTQTVSFINFLKVKEIIHKNGLIWFSMFVLIDFLAIFLSFQDIPKTVDNKTTEQHITYLSIGIGLVFNIIFAIVISFFTFVQTLKFQLANMTNSYDIQSSTFLQGFKKLYHESIIINIKPFLFFLSITGISFIVFTTLIDPLVSKYFNMKIEISSSFLIVFLFSIWNIFVREQLQGSPDKVKVCETVEET
tara:strand:- start:10633 stop:11421 length:789 start_codon:yes stop_codon:yes gene_type:complete